MFRIWGSLAIATALLVTQPVVAQSLADNTGPARTRLGAFAGARIRLDLGGMRREPVRAGLTLTSTRMLDRTDGRRRTAFGDGIAFGFAGDNRPTFSLAGQPVGRVAGRRNLSTAGTVAVVGGGLLLAGAIAFLIVLHEAEKSSD